MNKKKLLNWPFVLSLIVLLTFWTVVAFAVVALFSGCATKKELHELQTHVVQADTMARHQSAEMRNTVTTEQMDSALTRMMRRWHDEMLSREQQTETTRETVTTTTDSLGRETRQEQRTVTRTLSREEQRRIDGEIEQMQTEMHRSLQQQDSVWQQRFSEYRATMRDSLNSVRHQVQQSTPARSPLAQFVDHLKNIALYTCILAAVIIYIKRRKNNL